MYAKVSRIKVNEVGLEMTGTFFRRKNSSLSSSSSSETMYASVLSILGMITCSIAFTLNWKLSKISIFLWTDIVSSMWNIDDQSVYPHMNNIDHLIGQSTSTTPAVCRLDDLVQGDEGGLQACKLNKQVDCLLVVCLKLQMWDDSAFKSWIERITSVFLKLYLPSISWTAVLPLPDQPTRLNLIRPKVQNLCGKLKFIQMFLFFS